MGACPHPARGGHSGVATKLALPWLRARRETCRPRRPGRCWTALWPLRDAPCDGSATAQLGRDSSAACRVALDRPVLWHRKHRAVRPLHLIRRPLAFRRAGERSGSRGARPQVTYRRLPNSWLYVPLLHAAAADLTSHAVEAWRADPRAAESLQW